MSQYRKSDSLIRRMLNNSQAGLLLSRIGLALVLLVSLAVAAAGSSPFQQSLALADGRVLVVAEAALEPRSIGSYSIRLYSGATPAFPYDDFVCGIVVARDGFLERVLLEDIDGDGTAELIVIMRSAGSGSYISAQAFAIADGNINPGARVDDLAPTADPVEQLKD